MTQLDPSRYKRLTQGGVTYGVSDGLYWDGTNSQIVVVINDSIVSTVATTGVDDLLSSEAQGDVMRRGASSWERHASGTSGQILVGDGTDIASVAVTGATLSSAGALSAVLRATLGQDALADYTIPLTGMRVHDAPSSFLPTSASADDMGLIAGTFGTDSANLQGVDFGGAATDEMCRFLFKLPPEYDAGETITVRVHAGMLTTVADAATTVDAEVHLHDGEGAVGSDLVAASPASINSLTLGDKDFTVTPTGLVAGDELDIRLIFAGSDTGNLGVMIPIITKVSVLLDIKG